MAKQKKSKKKDNQILKMLLLSLAICVTVYAIYIVVSLIMNPTDTCIIEESVIYAEESTVGYVIRDESLVKSKNENKAIEQIKKEGEKVAKGNPIFKYYNVNESKINDEIKELDLEIQEALKGKSNLLPSDVKRIEEQINLKVTDIRKINNIQEIAEYKKDIENYIVKKAKIAGSLSKAGSYINGLIEKRAKLEDDLTKGTEYVNSPKSGIVSYRIDGLEEVLKYDNFSSLNISFLENLDIKTGRIVTSSDKQAKIVNNYGCYIAVILDSEEAMNAEEGNSVKIRLSNDEEVKAIIECIKEEKNERLIIFKINKEVEKLVAYRKISVDVIWWKYEGLRVPSSAILYEDGMSYVVTNKNGNISKVLVKIARQNNNYCIVESYETEELKKLGYTAEEINDIKTIKLYDEIIINPKVE